MFTKNKFHQTITIIVVLTMVISGIQPTAVSAQSGDGIKRQVNTESGKVSFIGPENGRVLSASRALGTFLRPQDPAMALAKRYAPEFGVKDPQRDLKEIKVHQSEDGRLNVRYQQHYQGIPVMGGELNVNTNGNGDLYSMNGEVLSSLSLSTTPAIDSEEARQTALRAAAKWYEKTPEDFVASTPELWIYDESLLQTSTRPAELVWRMEITPIDAGMPVRELVLVNAQRGNISLHFNQVDTSWTLTGSSGTSQDIDPTPTPLPPETAFPTETSIPSENPVLTETPIPAETSIPTETLTATIAALPTEEVPTRETLINEVTATGGVTWYVATTGSDSNSCSAAETPCATIKGALGKAGAGDLIRVASGTYTGTTSNIVIVSKSITLSGGWNNTFTLQNGISTIDGDGLRNSIVANVTGSVVVVESFIIQNSYSSADAGGISIYGANFTLKNSSVINNTARGRGAGVFVTNNGSLTVLNSTISGNTADSSGGGIHIASGTVTINNSTIAYNNSKGTGGGIAIGSGTVSLQNSLLAMNTAMGNGPDCSGSVTVSDHNIIGSTSGCAGMGGTGDQLNLDPLIDATLSGVIPFHALQQTSPAINNGDNGTCLLADQRNMPRPQGSTCDIGAYESAEEGRLLVVSGSDQQASFGYSFPLLLTVQLLDNSANPVPGATITFTAPASGPSGTFADTGTNITTAITDSLGQASASMFSPNLGVGAYNISATANGYSDVANFLLTNLNTLFVATTGSDSNTCMAPSVPCLTINGAISKAIPGDRVLVAGGTYTGLGTEVVQITKNITLSGGWDNSFNAQSGTSVIDGEGARRGVTANDVHAIIDRFTIQNGFSSSSGGGINKSRGFLILNNSLVTRNEGLSSGGGIENYGMLTINNTTISDNRTGRSGGSSGGGGGSIENYGGTVVMNNSTISGNVLVGDFQASGIKNNGTFLLNNSTVSSNTGDDAIENSSGTLIINNSTVSNNAMLGIRNQYGTVTLQNSILSNNSTAYSGQDCTGTITSLGHNLLGETSGCTFAVVNGDLVDVNPMLNASLVGNPAYHALLNGSPAIDAGNPATCLPVDQRGVARPHGTACDIGAYEYTALGAPAVIGIASGNDQQTGVSFPFPLPLRVYVVDGSGAPVSGVHVTFTAPAFGPSGTFADTGTNTTTVLVDADGVATSSAFTANAERGTYEIVATASGLSDSVSFVMTNSILYVSPAGNDENSCRSPADPCLTIIAAVDKAATIDVIKVATGEYEGIDVTKSLTISGGWDNTFTSQTGYSTIAGYSGIIADAPNISLSRLVVQNGHYGIYHGSGILSFKQGALINNDTGFHNAGGLATLTNITVSGNHASEGSGSAIMNYSGDIFIQYSTIANNSGDYAIRSRTTDSAHIEIGNSILAGNNGGDCYNPYINLVSVGHNIFGSSPACSGSSYFVPDPTDQVGTDPKLSPLLPVGYHPISANSPAIGNADPATCPATDQRDVPRPQGDACDIGAYEYAPSGAAESFGIASGSGQHSGPTLPFALPFIVYVIDASGNPVSGVDVTFMAPASGPSGTFADTGTNTTLATTYQDGQAIASIFTANSQLGTYEITAAASGLSGSVNFVLMNAAWFVSNTGKDSNPCNIPTSPCLTINSAIYKAANGDGILVAIGTYSPVQVSKSVSFLGGWNGTFTSQIGTSTIDGNISNHGIYASAPDVFFSRFVVQNSDFGIQHTSGKLRFERGALIHNNNGLYNFVAETTLTNITISGNDATDINGYEDFGSAIRNLGGFVKIQNSTITDNAGDYAIYNVNGSARIEIENSILAENEVEDCYLDGNGMISAGQNIFGRSPACSGPSELVPDPTDQVGTDPQLFSLLPMGYVPISSTSPAVDSADINSCPATDQRGITRPQGGACDIGAYEYAVPGMAASFGILSGSNQHSGMSLSFPLHLVVYVMDLSGSPVGGVNVTFTAPSSGPSGAFADTGSNSTAIITDEDGLAASPVFTANSELGAYNVIATVAGLPGSVDFALVNATWFVSPTGSDRNSCSSPTAPCLTINAAINKAAHGDSIKVAVGTYPPISIPKILILLGGWDNTFSSQIGYSTVDGNFTSNGMSVSGSNVSISRFTIQNSKFGIYHSGTGTLNFDRGAAIKNNNGLYNYSGTTIFTNTTISSNHAGDTDGYVYGGSAISIIHGRVTIQYSTIINNGGTEAISLVQTDAYLEIGNSILAGNPRWDCDGDETMISLGHNIFGSSPPCQHPGSVFVPHPTDLVGVDPKLGALFPLGYHPLMSDSPAIDAANSVGCPAVDQRGATRPAGTRCDIGAFEYNTTATTPQYIFAYEGSPQIIMVNSAASPRLIAIVFDEDGDRVQGKTVMFTAPDHGASAIFANTGTNTSTAVTDVNGFATSPAFSANSIGGSYFIVATVNGAGMPASFSLSNSTIALNPHIQTYTANNFISLPGTLLCDQSKPGCTNGFDVHADAAHKYAIGTYSLYAIEHSRNSINNAGMSIISSVHYSDAYANAAWTGSQMVYGDTYDFPLADDVVAHELTHGVTQYESNLFYYYQSGAINESFSDLWGEYYDQTNGEGNDTSAVKWLIGEDVSDLGALRSLSDPPAFGDPDKMSSSNYYTGESDNGGVHFNSGINNKAVFLMVDGGSFNGKTVAALGWDKTVAIYYEANTNLLFSGADYSDLYYALQQACSNLIGQKGITTADCTEVKNAIDAVEMNGQPIANFNTDAPYCDQGSARTTVFSDDLESGRGNWTFANGAYTRWQLDSLYGRYAHSGSHFLFADDYPGEVTDASARLASVTIPNDAYLHFAHAYDFEAYEASGYYDDGGVLEYSVDGGSTWNDAGSLIDFNGYKGMIRIGTGGNPLQGRSTFVGSSHGYISTRLNLVSLAGQTVIFRWRMGLDALGYAWGWWVDDVMIYQCLPTDTTPPTVSSITRVGAEYTSAPSVDFTVTFSEPVTGVDTTIPFNDFVLTTTGVTGAFISSVTGSGHTYTVTVNSGSGNGTIRLDVVDDNTIIDAASNPLGGINIGDGNFTSGEVYDVNKTVKKALKSIGTQDGWILESSETSNKGGTLNKTANLLYFGDNAQDKQYRSILSFNTSSLPDGAKVTKVQLKIKVQGFTGGNMFNTKTLGNLLMDIRKPYFGSSAGLVATDFQAMAGKNSIGVLGSVPGTSWRTVILNSSAYPFINLKGMTQFRLRFTKDDNDDLGADYLKIYSGDAPAANRPQLIVEYYMP